MNKFIKIRSSCFSILLLLISMFAVTNTDVNENNINYYLNNDCNSVANYIINNFSLFVQKYNESSCEKLNASYVEKSFKIMIVDHDGQKNGVFLDFDYENGYLIVGDEYLIYDFNINAESPYKNINSESYCYSTISGYLYLKDGEYINVEEERNMNKNCLDDISFSSKKYEGQDKAGCGHISDTGKYMCDKFGSGWNLSSNKSLSMPSGKYTSQMNLSCYIDYSYNGDSLSYSSEGNCWFVSSYIVLQSLADATNSYKDNVNSYRVDFSKPSMPHIDNIVNYDPKIYENSLYKKVFNDDGDNISGIIKSSSGKIHYKTELNNTSFPKLYTDVRRFVYNTYGKVNSGTVYNTAYIINEVGKQYGYNFKSKGTIAAGLYSGSGITAINKMLPFVLCTSSATNGGYGNHLMAGCGYKIYSKTYGWWIFKTTSYKYFYELRDGHSTKPAYFDLSSWTGFGGIVLLDYSIFNY